VSLKDRRNDLKNGKRYVDHSRIRYFNLNSINQDYFLWILRMVDEFNKQKDEYCEGVSKKFSAIGKGFLMAS